MTVYHNGVEVEIVAGNVDEAWAAVQHKSDDQPMDVHLGELGADDGIDEIQEDIETGNESLDLDLTAHRVRVRFPGEEVIIETDTNTRLYHVNFWNAQDEADEYDFVAKIIMDALQAVDMAYRQPSRLVFRNREELSNE